MATEKGNTINIDIADKKAGYIEGEEKKRTGPTPNTLLQVVASVIHSYKIHLFFSSENSNL